MQQKRFYLIAMQFVVRDIVRDKVQRHIDAGHEQADTPAERLESVNHWRGAGTDANGI